jgi:hypothetical protein
MPHEPSPVSSADQSRGEPRSNTDDLDTFWKAISLQAEARAARFRAISEEAGKGGPYTTGIRLKSERAFLHSPFNLVVALALGIVALLASRTFMIGAGLPLPLPT